MYHLCVEGLAEPLVVGKSSHGYGQLADGFQVDGSFVCRGDEGVHPPVCALRQQVDERLLEPNAQILKVIRWLHLRGIPKPHVALKHNQERSHEQTINNNSAFCCYNSFSCFGKLST